MKGVRISLPFLKLNPSKGKIIKATELMCSVATRLGGRLVVLPLLLAVTALSQPASAGIIINAIESSGDVIISYSGSLDLSGFSTTSIASISSRVRGGGTSKTAIIQFAPSSGNQTRYLSPFTGVFPTTGNGGIGPGTTLFNATSTTGGTIPFGVSSTDIYVDISLPANSLVTGLSGSATYAGKTLTDLGIATGTYTWTLKNSADTIVFNAGSSGGSGAVPEPSTAIVMGLLGIVGLAGNRRRRRQETVA
ncbi:PEP-CTERM sorting domain-containing protein [bacterium]|nr:PEP-CTERM sorting domain-containing protein [bacterium]